jgi:hypothetical protein
MKGTKLYKLSGALLILATLGFNSFFTLLSINFEYPDILRFPTGYVLERYPTMVRHGDCFTPVYSHGFVHAPHPGR